jgi:hypothetical protein
MYNVLPYNVPSLALPHRYHKWLVALNLKDGHCAWVSLCLAACKNKDFAANILQHLARAANLMLFLSLVLINTFGRPEEYLTFA